VAASSHISENNVERASNKTVIRCWDDGASLIIAGHRLLA
jgi:hypothetical protein